MSDAPICHSCGRELLDRPEWRERPLCLRCRFQGATLDPNFHPVVDKLRDHPVLIKRREGQPDTKFVVSTRRVPARTTSPMQVRRESIVEKDLRASSEPKPRIAHEKMLEVEGDEHLAKEALDEIEEIEGLKPKKVKKE